VLELIDYNNWDENDIERIFFKKTIGQLTVVKEKSKFKQDSERIYKLVDKEFCFKLGYEEFYNIASKL
jgi:hypothetical protein